jgi:hypothetical protein
VIVVAGTVEFDPERRDAALRAASELFAPTRAQPGCLDYVWCADPSSPSRVRGASVAKYRVDKSEPVYDPTGKPRADFFTD